MRILKTITIVMGVLIIAGTVTLAGLIARRLSPAASSAATLAPAVLTMPQGAHLASVAATADAVILWLHAPTGDRIVALNPHTLRPITSLALAPPTP